MKERLSNGEFGNTVRIYKSWDELFDSDYRDLVYVRSNVKMDTLKAFEVPFERLEKLIPIDLRDQCHYYEAPSGHRKIQGEIYRNPNGLYLYWSERQLPLRSALLYDGVHSWRLGAKYKLKQHLQPQSMDTLYDLLTKYPNSIIEFTEFSERMGTENKHLCIWELRNY